MSSKGEVLHRETVLRLTKWFVIHPVAPRKCVVLLPALEKVPFTPLFFDFVFSVYRETTVLASMEHKSTPPHSVVGHLREKTGFLGTTDVMAILGVSRKHLCKWVRQGRIHAYRFGQANAFDPLELAAWIENHRL